MKIITALLFVPISAFAMSRFVISFAHDIPADRIDEIFARVKTLSTETAGGKARISHRRKWIAADLSEAAVKEVRGMPGVLSVNTDFQFDPMDLLDIPTPVVRTADNVMRIVSFEPDISEEDGWALHERIAELARKTGTGVCEMVAGGKLRANLSSSAARDVAAMAGVTTVRDERSVGCRPKFD